MKKKEIQGDLLVMIIITRSLGKEKKTDQK
jgi:hypothetical protein